MPRIAQEEEAKMYDRKAKEAQVKRFRKWIWELAKEGKLKNDNRD